MTRQKNEKTLQVLLYISLAFLPFLTGEIVYSVVQTLTAEEILSSEIQCKQAGDLKCIHAGLPEEWATSEDKVAPVGAFNLDGKFPEVESNVLLVKVCPADSLADK